MKSLFLISILFSFSAFGLTKYKIDCHLGDCFTHGWKMEQIDGDYKLYNKCIENDCREKGWESIGLKR